MSQWLRSRCHEITKNERRALSRPETQPVVTAAAAARAASIKTHGWGIEGGRILS